MAAPSRRLACQVSFRCGHENHLYLSGTAPEGSVQGLTIQASDCLESHARVYHEDMVIIPQNVPPYPDESIAKKKEEARPLSAFSCFRSKLGTAEETRLPDALVLLSEVGL